MKYFHINTCPLEDMDLVCFDSVPEGMAGIGYKYNEGIPMKGDHPRDAKMIMTERYSGTRMSGLLKNIDRLLILHRLIADLMMKHDLAHDLIELLPVQIVNHKGRSESGDYVIVNPLGTLSCLDLERSEVRRSRSTGAIREIKKYVIKSSQLDARRALFRPQEQPDQFIARHDWIAKIPELALGVVPNVLGEEVEVSA